jgi:hypothetical protein
LVGLNPEKYTGAGDGKDCQPFVFCDDQEVKKQLLTVLCELLTKKSLPLHDFSRKSTEWTINS